MEEEEDFGIDVGGGGKEVEGEMREPILGRKGDREGSLPHGAQEGGDEEVRELERMMLKMQAVKGERLLLRSSGIANHGELTLTPPRHGCGHARSRTEEIRSQGSPRNYENVMNWLL